MLEHIAAIKALLAPLTVYYVTVPVRPALPYVLLWSSSGVPGDEQSVAGGDDLTDTIGVTSVAAAAEGVLSVRAQVRALLDGAQPTVAGRVVWLRLTDSQPTAVDTDVTPAQPYGVDLYRLVSTPA